MNIVLKDITDKQEWDSFVTSHKEANFLHSWQWGEFHISRGTAVVRRGAYYRDKLLGVYEGVVEPAKRGRHLAVAGGPIVNWQTHAVVTALRDDMQKVGREHDCVFVRVRPQRELDTAALSEMKKLGFRRAPMYLSVELAGVLNLEKTEEELLKGMRQRLRRALRKAEKNDIEVETTTDPAAIKEFYDIQLQTAGRHKFVAFSEDFFTKQFTAFAADNSAVLYTARYKGEVLAQNFMIFYGNEASYHYGVSTELGTKLSGAPLLHMQAMRDARTRGIGRYNFWGIVEEEDTGHRFYGVSVFKRGFGVDELRYVPAHDLVLKPLSYLRTWAIESARRKIRHV
ncbi:peptidoglycan bridge formation glycyltransferase FemA/FemB family protein [Candidatus Saccharibacteria bacterium]|nr:peptidoglycan bridge formation glycyltransferase FemA/FemB family protein [Candidatus Saccharibacteria bacterium]